ncbi:hypothetical protein [Herbaspirillum sp.]|uniref:hypothetical protein n=1 Tax=Herbaspirillum sp. TaxID=1890675 RepID=UPI001B26DFCC|nr:hypothetical protein [Herbaspirillum sp.]MBO9536075.1 hypothetical protein [Herbaspirillum sp.]
MDDSDSLRNDVTAFEPDPRMQHQSLPNRSQLINSFVLTSSTPPSVQIHFETAKNLYLYAWFVYRFHMVAEQYVFSTLELALRERLIEIGLVSSDRLPGLSGMLKLARSKDLISNERLVHRNDWTIRMAQKRYKNEEMRRMIEDGIFQLAIDESLAVPTAEESSFDWINHFIQHVPVQRNSHAHGTTSLYPNVLWTFEIVAELINQLFSAHKE